MMLKCLQEMMSLEYKYRPYHKRVADKELLADMIHVYSLAKCNVLTQKIYNEFGQFSSEKIVYCFGSWNAALKQAGLPQSTNRQYSNVEIFENLEYAWLRKGQQPVREDMNNKTLSRISSGAYLRRFGTWTNALKSFVEYMDDVHDQLDNHEGVGTPSAPTGRRTINLRMRWKVMRRDSFKCCLCGASPAKDPSVELHIDHIIPWSKGGETSLDNLRTLCSKCNLGKSDSIE